MRLRLFFPLLLISALLLSLLSNAIPPAAAAGPAMQDTPPPRLLMPLGGGYSELYAGFSSAAVANARDGQVKILVLPAAYATNAETITEAERADNLEAADERRLEIEAACQQAAPQGIICQAVLAPIFVRNEALDPAALDFFTPDLSAVFILGGDQTVAMRVIGDTPVEAALAELYKGGTIIAGTSAGGAMQARNMLAGYSPNFAGGNSAGDQFATGNALQFSAVDVWNSADRHGLSFGIPNAILDQHFYQRSRFGRLLNAISLPDVPHVGVGVDASTGVHAPEGQRLEDVFGLYTVTVLDAETYHAAEAVQYRGPRNLLSLRNVLVQLLSPGSSSYDLTTRQHSLAAPAPQIDRRLLAFELPPGAGNLILGGGLDDSLADNPLLTQFANWSGGQAAQILVVAAGYPSGEEAQRAAGEYAAALGAPAATLVIPQEPEAAFTPPDPDSYSGLVLLGRDPSLLPQALPALDFVGEAWRAGKPLLADHGAAALVGAYFAAHGPTPEDAVEAERATQQSFWVGQTEIVPGLGLLDLTLEPQVAGDNRWGRWFSLAYNHPELPAFGLSGGTALVIAPGEARVAGEDVVFALDLSSATLDQGENGGFVIANGLLDVFAPGDSLRYERADVNAAPIHAATPALPTATATLAPPSATPEPALAPEETQPPVVIDEVEPPEPTPTRRVRPTPVVPPPPDPGTINLMILFGVLAVVVVIAGVWINRKRNF